MTFLTDFLPLRAIAQDLGELIYETGHVVYQLAAVFFLGVSRGEQDRCVLFDGNRN
jgi:hypothetical protein